jgi:hypothetical protein
MREWPPARELRGSLVPLRLDELAEVVIAGRQAQVRALHLIDRKRDDAEDLAVGRNSNDVTLRSIGVDERDDPGVSAHVVELARFAPGQKRRLYGGLDVQRAVRLEAAAHDAVSRQRFRDPRDT